MTSHELYTELTTAYSQENLNNITGKLILLYKNKNYSSIRTIANKLANFVTIEEENDAKCFAKLIVLYHPDKGHAIRNEIQQLYEQNDLEGLLKFTHIRLVQDIDRFSIDFIDDSIDYNPEYIWDTEEDNGYHTDREDDEMLDNDCEEVEFERSFFNLIKIREYGTTSVEVPTYYLEDFEEFEMAESGLESLDGVEYCKHIKILDVSGNMLSDISNLWNLHDLEELYLGNNQIGYIDALDNLSKLRTLDLSGNEINDISPLFNLERLEYVNLVGNPVPKAQIKLLKQKEILVMH